MLRRALASAGLAALAAQIGACGGGSTSPTTLSVTPAAPAVGYGELVQLTLQGSTGRVDWSTSDPTIAIVTRGRVWGMGVGTATITATQGGRSATTDVTVNSVPTTPTMAADIQPIFDHVCASCHTGAQPQSGIDLTNASTSLASLVNHTSPSRGTGVFLVIPGDYFDSYLSSMVQGSAVISTDNMPSGCSTSLVNSCLPVSAQNLIIYWIATGAN